MNDQNPEGKYDEYTQGMTDAQKQTFYTWMNSYDNRFSYTAPSAGAGDADAPMLKDYAPDIQGLLSNDQFSGIYDATNRAAKERMLEDNGIDSKSFFEQKPDATAIDVMQATNFNGYAEKEKAYSDPSMFDREEDRANALEELKNEFDSSFQNSFLFPELGSALDELIPDYIRNDPEKRADFEKAFYHETGGIKLDFDDSGRVGDVYTDSSVGNFMRSVGYNLSDLGTEIMDGVLGTSNAVVSLFSDLGEQNEEFLQAQESGEYQSQIEAADDFWQMSDNSLFWASFSSPEARKQLYASKKNLRTVDFQALLDRGMDNSSAGELWGNGVDQLIQSAPLLLDLYTGGALAKGALKGVTKGITKRATGRAAKSAAKSESILKQAGRANSLINTGGAIVFSDVLVASQMHADNVGQEWYDNLSTMDRASYLAHQSSAEVISGMVLNKVMMRLPPSKMTRAIFDGQKGAITEWGKNIARTTLMGITEEGVAEAGTAAWQYASEIKARQAGGDQTAYYDSKEMTRRVMDSAAAGILMGGIAGGVGAGVIRGGFSASLAKYTGNIKRSQDSLQAAAEEADNARTKAAKEAAFDRLEAMTKKHSGATSAVTRAYERLRVKNPEIFNSIVEIQGRVNALVQQYKSGTQSEVAVRGEIVSLLQEKQRLENEAFGGQHGDPTFEGVIKEEVNSIAKERGDKVKEWKQGYDSSPEAQAERALNEEIDVQKASLEAAVAANSPDQNADDDAQDTPDPTGPQAPEKETDIPEGSQTVRGTSSEPLNPDAVANTRYRAIAKRANKLMKAFKGAVSEVVVHTTAESYAKAIGKTDVSISKGAFKGGIVHVNLSNPNADVGTVRHEFLHAAFVGKSLAAKKALLKELDAVATRYGLRTAVVEGQAVSLATLQKAVKKAYEGSSDNDLTEEQIVNALEYFLDQEIFGSEPKLGQRILNAFKKFFGGEVTISELAGFVESFRAAEKGKEIKAEQAAEVDPEMESRDLGVSKAYPDLQNSQVKYWVRQVNKLGGEMHNTETKVFKDYWHFRNWWVQQTGNGKRANMLGGFEYTNADGQKKTVNEPRPKLDRETGQPIDVQPLLKTINETKRETTERGFAKSDKAFNSSRVQKFVSNVVNRVIDNEFNKEGDAYTLDSELVREPLKGFEVVETVEFTAEKTGRRYNTEAAEAQAKEYVQSIADMVPVGKGADYVFQVSADGDGKAKVELLVKDAAAFEQLKQAAVQLDQSGSGETLANGEVTIEGDLLEARKLNIKATDVLGKETSRGDLLKDINGKLAWAFGFDRTGKKSGVRDLFKRSDVITAHIDKKFANSIVKSLKSMALEEVERSGLKDGDIGYIATLHTLLSDKSSLGNPLVFKDIISGTFNVGRSGTDVRPFITIKSLEDALNKNTANSEKLKTKLQQNIPGGNAVMEALDRSIANGEAITVTKEMFESVQKILTSNSGDFSFKDRTEIAEVLLPSDQKKEYLVQVYDKHNDKVWGEANVDLGEVVAYTLIPFKYNAKGATNNAKITGFESSTDPKSKNPFQGLIVYEEISDRDGNQVAAPELKVPRDAYHLAELFPGQITKFDKKLEEIQEVSTLSEGSIKQQKKEANIKAGISAVKGLVEATSFVDLENQVYTPEKQSLTLNFEGTDTNLPFEPNRLNYFQAKMARLDQLFANKYANVMRLQKDIQKGIGKAVELGQDFINAETLLYGRTANDLDKLDGKVKEISKEMKDSGLTSDEVTEYLIARHARERNAVIEERNGKKNGSGMSNADADAVINGISVEGKAKLDSLAKKIDAIQKDTRDTMRKYGLETNERIDAFEGMFKNYVPLGGVAIDDLNVESTSYPTGGAGITIYGDTTKRAKGRKSMAVNVMAQVIAQNAAVHTKARKNEALSSLHNLVKANPNERVWSIKDEVSLDSENAVGVRINGEQKYIVFNDASHAKSLKNMGVEKLDVISKLMRVPAAWLRRSFTTANPEFIISNFARDIQSALFNGLAEADIPGGQIQGRHIAAKIIGRVKNTLPALIKGTFGKDMGAEMEAYFDEFKEDGGQTGWGFVKPLNQIASEIEAESTEPGKVKKAVRWMAKHSIDVVENVNDAFENSIRLAAYIEAREAGVSRAKAAELAKNITVNFNRSGELGPVANAWYLFFNASVQGTVRLARSLGTLKDVRKPDGELESWHKRLNAAQKMAFGLSLTSGMLAAVNMAMSDEDEDGVLFYSKIPDYVKERNLIIMYDGKNHIKIPLPYGFNIFSNFGTAMAEVAGGQREMTEAAMFMSNSAFSSFSPISFGQSKDMAKYLQKGITPTVLKPLVEIATNETFFGGSVFRDQFPIGAPKPESELAFRSPEVIQSFFSWMNKSTGGSAQVPGSVDVNPDKFWYGFEYYIGGAGQFVTRSLGTGRDMFEMMKEGEKVKMSANDFPFLRKVYGESSKYYDSDGYTENSNLISQLYKERKESDDKRSDRYAGVTKLESMRKSTEKKLKALRKKRKEARDIKNYVDKQNRIHELYEKERSLLMQFNKAFEKYHGE